MLGWFKFEGKPWKENRGDFQVSWFRVACVCCEFLKMVPRKGGEKEREREIERERQTEREGATQCNCQTGGKSEISVCVWVVKCFSCY